MTDYSAAAAALEVSESLVKRSADARAKADNVAVDDLLSAWSGGGAAPKAAAPTPTETPAPTAPAADSTPAEAPATPVTTAPSPVPPAPTPAPVTSGAPPVLVGANQGTFTVMAGSIGILFVAIIIGFVVPSLPQPGNGVRTSAIALTAEARAGRTVYAEQGCGSCHTQLIRAVVGDANLGPVTLSDSNQSPGLPPGWARPLGSRCSNRVDRLGTGAAFRRGATPRRYRTLRRRSLRSARLSAGVAVSDLAAAAAALGVPEALVQRSAEARSKASGTSVDEILAAWAGGSSAPAGSAPAPAASAPACSTSCRGQPDRFAGGPLGTGTCIRGGGTTSRGRGASPSPPNRSQPQGSPPLPGGNHGSYCRVARAHGGGGSSMAGGGILRPPPLRAVAAGLGHQQRLRRRYRARRGSRDGRHREL